MMQIKILLDYCFILFLRFSFLLIFIVFFRFLWYIKLCLSGKTIAGTNIDLKIYELVIQQLVLWIFEKENLIALLELDSKFTFDICYLFFNGFASTIIRKFHSYMKINIKDLEKYENLS